MRAWGRLLRLSLAPSAAADVAAGTVLGAGCWPSSPAPFVLMAGSLAVYHGGMALNDWADRREDETLRRDRPISSGAVPANAALVLAFALLLGGPTLALQVNRASAFLLATVALLAIVYDLRGRGPWRGPLLLAACRAGNLFAGIACGLAEVDREVLGGSVGSSTGLLPTSIDPLVGLPWSWWARTAPVALLYGAYVLVVSRLGRLEDVDDEVSLGRKPAAQLSIAVALLCAAPLAAELARRDPWIEPGARWIAALALAALAARGPLMAARRKAWTRADVVGAMGMCLRRLLVFTALVALAAGGADGWLVAAAILAGYPISYALRGVFPPS